MGRVVWGCSAGAGGARPVVGARFWSGYAGDGLLLPWKGSALLAGAPVCFVDEGGLQPFVYQAMPIGVGALCYKLCYKSDPGPTGLLVGGESGGSVGDHRHFPTFEACTCCWVGVFSNLLIWWFGGCGEQFCCLLVALEQRVEVHVLRWRGLSGCCGWSGSPESFSQFWRGVFWGFLRRNRFDGPSSRVVDG